jgi:type I restriction enzyme S subunit
MSKVHFYRETKFKKTEIGEIPEEWEVKSLKERVKKIKAGGTPKTTVKEYYENGNLPFVKIEDLTQNGKYLTKTALKITKKGLNNSSAWIVPKNSVLLAMYGSLGEVSINKIEVATNQAILGIVPNEMGLNPEFLYYWFLRFKPKWVIYAKTTTQANLTKQIVENIKIPLPPLEEQKEIAKRLKVIDDQIENLKKQKEHLQKVKKKFMDLLLTGKLRIKIN